MMIIDAGERHFCFTILMAETKEFMALEFYQMKAGKEENEFREFNVKIDSAASQLVFGKWPTEVLYSGFEIGEKIKTGLPLVKNSAIQNSPVKDVFSICLPKAKEDSVGRSSWDETAVLVALNGHAPYYSLQPGAIIVNDNGSNSWDRNGKNQHYLVEKLPHTQVQELINKLLFDQLYLRFCFFCKL